ncbi:hypothetical protein FVEG_00785 [Fusarium verticillioides 7600]|uniref:Uncharacterized protein n=1 Tax=Gibberella moniliformis (strain M3125 / FGSC 7600) TaxID=334819 RepID=W7LNE4_GIBM7|nr:hypothetical protein FVEG_00785 [Fusarium verticillioides 7600]EWG36939.1 hypothetical protein FVEG_00785 [Fusarium verticillioides 7600]
MAQTGSRTFKCSQQTPACPSIQGPQSAGPRPLLGESIGCHSTISKVPIPSAARQAWVSLFFSSKIENEFVGESKSPVLSVFPSFDLAFASACPISRPPFSGLAPLHPKASR